MPARAEPVSDCPARRSACANLAFGVEGSRVPLSPGIDNDTAQHGETVVLADEWGEPQDFSFIVRPYSWTQGRTRPVQDLAVETLVSTTGPGRDSADLISIEYRAIAQLCAEIRSVAEVAALLALPLGIARVLLADMADLGLLHVHRSSSEAGAQPDLVLLERVLAGLRRL
jgi:Protein of unknown function (DUF742)